MPKIDKPLKSSDLAECGVPEWDVTYVNVEQETLFELILAANYMDIKDLLDLTCAKVASMIKGPCCPPACSSGVYTRPAASTHTHTHTLLC